MCLFTSRWKSTSSGRSHVRSSVLAEPSSTDTGLPFGIGQPLRTVSWVVMRMTPCTGVSQRSISSTAWGIERRVVDELLPLLGVLGEVGEHAVERRGDGVEPGEEEQVADVDDVLGREPVAVDLGVEEQRDEVVLALGSRRWSTTSCSTA